MDDTGITGECYKVIFAQGIDELSDGMNFYVNRGWIPQGGVFVDRNQSTGKLKYFQAIYRESIYN